MIDLTALTEEELHGLYRDAANEMRRRDTIATIEEQAAAVNVDYLNAVGRASGEEWVQPTGAHDAHPLGWIVTRDGKTYESLVPANVWVPGDPNNPVSHQLWREVVEEEPEEPGEVEQWDPNGREYAVDDLVLYEGETYECIQAHTSQPGWDPLVIPALWRVII